jgi:hypothetical protein
MSVVRVGARGYTESRHAYTREESEVPLGVLWIEFEQNDGTKVRIPTTEMGWISAEAKADSGVHTVTIEVVAFYETAVDEGDEQ